MYMKECTKQRKETIMLNVDFKNCPIAFEPCGPDQKAEGMFGMVKRDDEGKVTHRLTYECQSILALMMGIGMGKITKSTVDEFIERCELWQDVIGAAGPGNYPKYQIDDFRDANGYFTIRLYDGTPNGDTESCIGTIFEEKHADMLIPDAIDYARITPDDIRNHIGLSSNVAKEPWATFWKKLRRNVQDRLYRAAQRAAKEAAA